MLFMCTTLHVKGIKTKVYKKRPRKSKKDDPKIGL